MAKGDRLDLVESGASGGNPSPMVLALVTGFSAEETETLYFQLFDLLEDPTPGAIPLRCWPVAPGGTFSYAPAQGGLKFAVGYAWAISSTAFIFTAAAAAEFWVQTEGRLV